MGEDNTVTLRDGRKLAYAEFGDPDGAPAFYFHGTPGSRYEARHASDAALRARVRLIAVDRPGVGRSDKLKGRTLDDWPRDVAELADALGFERFAIVGLSGGGPHVAACAHQLASRLTAAVIVSGAGPPEAGIKPGAGRVRRWLYRATLKLAPLTAPGWVFQMMLWIRLTPAAWMPRWVDPKVLSRKEAREEFHAALREAFRQGSGAAAREYVIFSRPWTFRLEDIGVRIDLWHGDADRVVPVHVGRYYEAHLPDCEARYIAGGGHAMIVDYIGPIMQVVGMAASR